MNMSNENATIQLPVVKGKKWCVALDTSLQSPQDIISPQDQKPFGESCYSVNSKAVVVFEMLVFEIYSIRYNFIV